MTVQNPSQRDKEESFAAQLLLLFPSPLGVGNMRKRVENQGAREEKAGANWRSMPAENLVLNPGQQPLVGQTRKGLCSTSLHTLSGALGIFWHPPPYYASPVRCKPSEPSNVPLNAFTVQMGLAQDLIAFQFVANACAQRFVTSLGMRPSCAPK